jgi:hypothetical protein
VLLYCSKIRTVIQATLCCYTVLEQLYSYAVLLYCSKVRTVIEATLCCYTDLYQDEPS